MGKKILLTGATGFLGQALLERLIVDVPDCRLVLLVRGLSGRSGAAPFPARRNPGCAVEAGRGVGLVLGHKAS